MNWRRGLGIALIVGGLVLALLVPDLEFLWFQGRSLGILLIVLGVVDIADGARRARGRRPPGLLAELGDDLGLRRAEDRAARGRDDPSGQSRTDPERADD